MLSVSVGVSLAAVISPLMSSFLTLTGSSFHDDQRAVEMLCLLLGVVLTVLRLGRGKPMPIFFGKPVLLLLTLFFTFGLISGMLAYSPRHALYEWSSFGLLLLLAWLIAGEVALHPESLLDWVLLLFGLGCALYVFKAALIYAWVLQSGSQPDPSDFIHGFGNYRFFNHIQTVSLPLLGLLVLRSRQGGTASSRQIVAWYGLLSLWWMLLFASGGRGTFFGLLGGILMVLFWRYRQALPWFFIMLRSGIAGLVTYVIFFLVIPVLMNLQSSRFLNGVLKRSIDNSGSSRSALWQRAGEMIIANPLLGAGPLHFAHYGQDINNGSHPHNWALQVAAEWGIPALFCISGVFFIGFKRLLRTAYVISLDDQKNQSVLTVWLAIGVAILVDGLVSGLIVMPSSQLWIVLYIGLAWGWTENILKSEGAKEFKISKSIRFCLSITLLLILFFLGNGIFPEIIDLTDRQNLQLELFPQIRLAPRIWSFGYF